MQKMSSWISQKIKYFVYLTFERIELAIGFWFRKRFKDLQTLCRKSKYAPR
jgi:hypothetical protein